MTQPTPGAEEPFSAASGAENPAASDTAASDAAVSDAAASDPATSDVAASTSAKSARRRWKTLLAVSLPVLLLGTGMSLSEIPYTGISMAVPYAAEGEGPTYNTLGEENHQPVVEISGVPVHPTSGNLNLTTVSVRYNMSLAQALARYFTSDDTFIPLAEIFPPQASEEEVEQRNQQQFTVSGSAATIAALRYLGHPLQVEIAQVQPHSAADGKLHPGDLLLRVNGEPVTDAAQVKQKIGALHPGDEVTLVVRSGNAAEAGTERTVPVTVGKNPDHPEQPFLGIFMSAVSAENIKVQYHLEDIGGPSAGMMFALAVIDKISGQNINGGKFVAGTGTIAEDGTVGPIGGVNHKIAGAQAAGAELFLLPEENCAEAKVRPHPGITLAKVRNLTEAVDAMRTYADGKTPPACE